MKRIAIARIVLITLFTLTTTTIFSQDKRDYIRILTDSMKARLSLNEGQYGQVYNINKSFSEKMAALRKDNVMPRAEKGKQLKQLGVTRDSSLKKVLSADQFDRYEAHKSERRQQAKERYERKQEEK
ncbi:hypothetical protein [Chitinophaga sp. sic0106]|uniref:hypothetical protein n=1 Tax=Chitinophaga sp. sic0106 TaxID=2854785 RepID=UPI001C480BBF|nr:hypothetical protein [Chitinophaga sp. sic0106]MBV7532068.1 hypothetical protein [Chitinophaga sp. sic0106]